MFIQIIYTALLLLALWLLAHKWGLVDYYQLHRPRWMPKSCNFCLFFWLAVLTYTAGHWGEIWAVSVAFRAIADALVTAVVALILKNLLFYERI